MNLLDEAWIPVRRKDGKQDWIAPYQITEPDVVALDARRPDFSGALIQFLIGLVQTTTPMDSHVEWQQWNTNPPTVETLKKWFEPVREAFVFDGDGARFMQDFSLRTEGVKDDEFNDTGALLIESPGEQTLKENKDHFVKRGNVSAVCFHCVATALFTLQINAPGGGSGHYTSIRGIGPLTTLVIPEVNESIWKLIWMHVRDRSQFLSANGDSEKKELQFTFPWLKEMASVQPQDSITAPTSTHPAHVFWGMPRRIRLDFDNPISGVCQICGRDSERLVVRYLTKAKGFDYKGGWIHPLSPYNEFNPGEMQAAHPQQGGIAYKHWLGWVLGLQSEKKKTQPASIVSFVLDKGRLRGKQYRIWAYGYDIHKSNKIRCWYDSTLPVYSLAEHNLDGKNLIQREVTKWIEAADHAALLLRSNVKFAWFGEGDARGDLSFIDSAFWSQTESGFYQQLKSLIDQARDDESDPVLLPLRESWRDTLIKVSERLFDADFIGVAPVQRQNPRRIAEAYNKLRINLRGDKLKEILKLPVEKKEKKEKKTKKSPKSEA